jgi:hypothetical protein
MANVCRPTVAGQPNVFDIACGRELRREIPNIRVRRVPCEFAGHPFEILCGDARDNKANPNGCAVPPAGVIGYDFFANFTLVVDRLGGKMTSVKN